MLPWRHVLGLALFAAGSAFGAEGDVTFVLTSDVHFGITRPRFRGQTYVNAATVNAAEVQSINALPRQRLPADGGLRAGEPIGKIDFVAITGDLANRQELYPVHIQPAAASWRQFEQCYIDGLTLGAPLYYIPGNHDVSDAIGAPTVMVPRTDPTSMVEIYNRMMRPATPLTNATFRYPRDRVTYSRDIGGVHCIFLTIWPDSQTRAWIDRDLASVAPSTPVFLFCHDPVQVDPKHLINPFHDHGINREDGYENLLSDQRAATETEGKATPVEDRVLAAFLRRHRNIVAWFHGHENWHEAYTWTGPDGDLNLHVFRADSPMKGRSRKEEGTMSYEVIVYNAARGQLTDREYLWNAPQAWGQTTTVDIAPLIPATPAVFRIDGRIDARKPGAPVLIWENTKAEVNFTGTAAALDFREATDQNFFNLTIDGATREIGLKAGPTDRIALGPLPPGQHHLELYKRTEASTGHVTLAGIEVQPGAAAWAPAAPSYAHRFIFYGDSITVGACNEDGPTDQWDDRSTHNASLSYAALTAAALGADLRNISISGMGISIGWVPMRTGEVWDKLYPDPSSAMANLTAYRPDVVFVNYGENDCSYPAQHGMPFPADFASRYEQFVGALRQAYPHAEIVLLRGGMSGGAKNPDLRAAWQTAVTELEGRDPHIAHYVFHHWSANHPRVPDDRALASELVEWLRGQPFLSE